MSILLGADIDQTWTTLDEGKTPALGDVFYGSGGKIYKFVQYEAATAAVAGVAGEVAYYYLLDGYKNNIVTSDLSDATGEIGAGVLVASPADAEYCWIQIRGPATLTIALTAGVDGDPLTPTGAGDGTLDVNVATAANTHICAWAGDASDKEIICNFPF
jgi:hypothetical protein